MNHFMARLIFCFFAEDTDIFNVAGLFTTTIERMSERDSSNTHEVIGAIFRAMNTKVGDRAATKRGKAAATKRLLDAIVRSDADVRAFMDQCRAQCRAATAA
jgi:hypothetical protein